MNARSGNCIRMSALTKEKVYQQFVWVENGKIVVATETGEFRLTPAESKDLCDQFREASNAESR
jgi:hypothetical protein